MDYISTVTREKLAAAAKHRCEYCQTAQAISGGQMHIEHIIPESRAAHPMKVISVYPVHGATVTSGPKSKALIRRRNKAFLYFTPDNSNGLNTFVGMKMVFTSSG